MDELITFLVRKINVNVGAEEKGNFITPRFLAWVPGEAHVCVVVAGGVCGQSLKCVPVLVAQSCLFVTPWTAARQGSSLHGILQTRVVEWVAIPFSKGHSWLRDPTQVLSITGSFFTVWATSTTWHAQTQRWRIPNTVLGGWSQVSGERELLVPPSTKGIFLPGLSWKRNTNLMGYVFLCFRSSSTWLGSLFLPAMQISFSRRAQLPVSVLCLYRLQLATCPGKNGLPWWLSGWDAGDIRSREKEMAVHSSILAWEIPWTEDLAGYSPGGHKESDTTLQLNNNNNQARKADITV